MWGADRLPRGRVPLVDAGNLEVRVRRHKTRFAASSPSSSPPTGTGAPALNRFRMTAALEPPTAGDGYLSLSLVCRQSSIDG